MEAPFQAAEVTSNPVTSPEKLAGKLTNGNKDWVFFATLAGLIFFGVYAYKTFLEVQVAKQALLINEQELLLNKQMLEENLVDNG